MPFEPQGRTSIDRLAFVPRAGGLYRAVSGAEIELAKVIGRDGDLWFAIDVNERPVALRRIHLIWSALPKFHLPPARGDIIVHQETQSVVACVLGEAEVGGWIVANKGGVTLHVLHAGSNRWMCLGAVDTD